MHAYIGPDTQKRHKAMNSLPFKIFTNKQTHKHSIVFIYSILIGFHNIFV